MEIGAVSAPDVRGNRYFFAKREGTQNQPVIYWREGYRGDDRVLIDPAADRRRRASRRSSGSSPSQRRQARSPTAPTAPATRTRRCT